MMKSDSFPRGVQFDGVFDGASQEDVFRQTVQKHMDDVMQGYSVAVIAYGATSSGKTYTMSSNRDSYCHRGLIPRALSHLFTMAETSTDRFVTTRISCLEIYNDQMYDLLADNLSEATNLQCLEDSSGAITIKVRDTYSS
jgi:kinesin family member 6/9